MVWCGPPPSHPRTSVPPSDGVSLLLPISIASAPFSDYVTLEKHSARSADTRSPPIFQLCEMTAPKRNRECRDLVIQSLVGPPGSSAILCERCGRCKKTIRVCLSAHECEVRRRMPQEKRDRDSCDDGRTCLARSTVGFRILWFEIRL